MTNRMPFIYQIATENDESSEVANFPIIFAQRIITVCIRDGTEKPKKKHARKQSAKHILNSISNFIEDIQIYSIFSHNLARLNQLILVWEKFLRQTHTKNCRDYELKRSWKKNGEHTMHNCE